MVLWTIVVAKKYEAGTTLLVSNIEAVLGLVDLLAKIAKLTSEALP